MVTPQVDTQKRQSIVIGPMRRIVTRDYPAPHCGNPGEIGGSRPRDECAGEVGFDIEQAIGEKLHDRYRFPVGLQEVRAPNFKAALESFENLVRHNKTFETAAFILDNGQMLIKKGEQGKVRFDRDDLERIATKMKDHNLTMTHNHSGIWRSNIPLSIQDIRLAAILGADRVRAVCPDGVYEANFIDSERVRKSMVAIYTSYTDAKEELADQFIPNWDSMTHSDRMNSFMEEKDFALKMNDLADAAWDTVDAQFSHILDIGWIPNE